VGERGITSGEEQIRNVLGNQAAQGDSVRSCEGNTDIWRLFAEHALRDVDVDGPAAVGDSIVKDLSLHDIVLVQPVSAFNSPGFAFAGQWSDPVEGEIFRAVIAVVLHVVPDSHQNAQQLAVDLLIVVDGGSVAAGGEPPEPAAEVSKLPR